MDNLEETINSLSLLIDNVVEKAVGQVDFNDLTNHQLHYLRIILKMKNPSISEIAAELKLKKPTVTVLVDRLVAKGYVIRVRSDKDRRCMHLHFSEKGMQIRSILETAGESLAKRIRSVLSETETLILTDLFKKVVKSADK